MSTKLLKMLELLNYLPTPRITCKSSCSRTFGWPCRTSGKSHIKSTSPEIKEFLSKTTILDESAGSL